MVMCLINVGGFCSGVLVQLPLKIGKVLVWFWFLIFLMQTVSYSTLVACGLTYTFHITENNLLNPVMSLALPHIYRDTYKLKNGIK